jgi:hypothetical protein
VTAFPDWVDIPPAEFTIRGNDGSSVRLVTDTLLVEPPGRVVAMAFKAHLTLHAPCFEVEQSLTFGHYGEFVGFRDELVSVRNGAEGVATFDAGNFVLTIGRHGKGVHEGMLVQGACSSVKSAEYSPWPNRRPIGDLIVTNPETHVCMQFAFLTSQVDPPYLDNAIQELNAIIRQITEAGFTF